MNSQSKPSHNTADASTEVQEQHPTSTITSTEIRTAVTDYARLLAIPTEDRTPEQNAQLQNLSKLLRG
jgi:hypothetical protein